MIWNCYNYLTAIWNTSNRLWFAHNNMIIPIFLIEIWIIKRFEQMEKMRGNLKSYVLFLQISVHVCKRVHIWVFEPYIRDKVSTLTDFTTIDKSKLILIWKIYAFLKHAVLIKSNSLFARNSISLCSNTIKFLLIKQWLLINKIQNQ